MLYELFLTYKWGDAINTSKDRQNAHSGNVQVSLNVYINTRGV